jgi:phosphate transport system substrate-binding protein
MVLTRGALTVECDEAVAPVFRAEVEEFQRQYPEAAVELRAVDGREAVSNFAMDSVRVIVLARALNTEERNALAAGKVSYEEYHVAQTAVAVIAHADNPLTRMRTGELDSVFSGIVTAWPGSRPRKRFDLVVCGVNSSTNEILRTRMMEGKPIALSATPMASSPEVFEYVRKTRGALGILDVSWLKGVASEVTVLSLGTPGWAPDSTQQPGAFYSPAQAYVYKDYYPLSSPVYIYSREQSRDLSLGFISFVAGAEGQKVILNSGIVPVTMPVRLIHLTAEEVQG